MRSFYLPVPSAAPACLLVPKAVLMIICITQSVWGPRGDVMGIDIYRVVPLVALGIRGGGVG